MKRKPIILATASLLTLFTLTACSGGKSVATMKGGKITQEEFYDKLKDNGGKKVLQQMIITKVLDNKYGKDVPDKKVTAEFNKTKKQYGQNFAAALDQSGLTEDSYRDSIKFGLLVTAATKAHAKVTNADLKEEWKSYHPQVDASIIRLTKKEDADNVLKQLKDGGDFAKIAKEKSTDGNTKKDGGKIKFDSTSQEVPTAVQTAAYKLKDGQLSDVITVADSYTGSETYYIVKMNKNKDKGNDLTPYKKTLKKIVMDKKVADQTTQFETIRKELKEADVKISDDKLKDALSTFLTDQSKTSNSSSSSKKTTKTSSSKKAKTSSSSSKKK